MDIFGNDLLVALGSAFPFLVTGYVSIYNNPMLPSIGSAFHRLDSDTTTGHGSVYGNAALITLDTAFCNFVTVTGHLSIDDNASLATLDTVISSLVTVTGHTSIANTPLFALCNRRWFPGCGANRPVPRNDAVDDGLAIISAIDVRADQLRRHVLPDPGSDPRSQPPARPRS